MKILAIAMLLILAAGTAIATDYPTYPTPDYAPSIVVDPTPIPYAPPEWVSPGIEHPVLPPMPSVVNVPLIPYAPPVWVAPTVGSPVLPPMPDIPINPNLIPFP